MRAIRTVSFWTTLLLALFVILMLLASARLPETARGFPIGVAVLTLVLLLLSLAAEFRRGLGSLVELELDIGGSDAASGAVLLEDVPWKLVGLVFGSLLVYGLAVLLVGFTVASPFYVLLFLRLYGGAGWSGAAVLAVGTTVGVFALSRALRSELYGGLLLGTDIPPF